MNNRYLDGGEATVREMQEHNKRMYKQVREYKTILHGQEVTVRVFDYINPAKQSYDSDAKITTARYISEQARAINETGFPPERNPVTQLIF